MAEGVRAKHVKVAFSSTKLKVVVEEKVLLEGALGGSVDVDDCTFTLERNGPGVKELAVTLGKKDGSTWPFVIK